MTDPITVAAVQMHSRPGCVELNLSRAAGFIRTAAQRGARLVALPELFNVGYFVGPELFGLWEDEHGRTVTWMRQQAQTHGMLVAGTIAERRDERLYNTMFIAEPGGALHRYAKRRPTLTERSAFDPGDDDPVAVTSLGRVGRIICAEIIYADCLQRLRGGVDIVVFSQASFAPRLLGRGIDWWERRTGRSIVAPAVAAIGAPLVCAGMVGPVQRMTRFVGSYLYGSTCIADARGRVADRVGLTHEGVATASIVPENTGGNGAVLADPGKWRSLADRLLVRLPDLRTRRADGPAERADYTPAYECRPLTQRFTAKYVNITPT